jgi:hypothetical protein
MPLRGLPRVTGRLQPFGDGFKFAGEAGTFVVAVRPGEQVS